MPYTVILAMGTAFSFITDAVLFVALYIQVFLIITFFEYRDERGKRADRSIPAREDLPSIAVIVPCFNEGTTVIGTIESLKGLSYPKDKLSIVAVDDGSTDNTWAELQRYADDAQVSLYQKENGGKHSAVNYGIERSESALVSCLDADSFVDPEALNRMLPYLNDPSVMAVTPAIRIRAPYKGLLEHIQHAEYNIAVFLRKMYSMINAIHVTPGPFSVFRREVFEKIGMFRSAYNTEDLEIALRMHRHNMKIENAHTAYVYTTPPSTFRALIKQRVRWTTGFLLNIKDYKDLLFNPEHGQIGTFTLPAGVISLVSVLFLTGTSIVNAATNISKHITQYQLVGFSWHWTWGTWQWFFVDTTTVRFLTWALIASAIIFILIGKRMANGTWSISRDMIYYAALYGFIAPIWIAISGFQALTNRTGSWR